MPPAGSVFCHSITAASGTIFPTLTVDLALIQVTPPDARGQCSLGVSVHFVPAVLERAKLVVAEVNASMPRPHSSYEISYERLDYVALTGRPVLTLQGDSLSDDVRRIGANVASLIEDGDVIQIGIGKVPAAVLGALQDRRDLGLHSGLIADQVADLYAAGVMRGRMVCTAAIGSRKVYDFAAGCSDFTFAPVSYTHDPAVMAATPNLVAINSVLSVDLMGQANAEMLDGRQVSGTGGLLDFVRGARLSRGGRSILALPATAAGGKISRIVAKLGERDIVSCPRADADIVVTEHGIARLREKSLEERAEALIRVAAPGFREGLAKGWRGSSR